MTGRGRPARIHGALAALAKKPESAAVKRETEDWVASR
jgi:hypothetical protein